jgi:hypothetical protein
MIKRRICAFIGAWIVAAGLSLAVSAPAVAQSLFLPAGSDASAESTSTHAKRQRLVRIDANVLASRIAPAGTDHAANREQRAARLGDTVRLNLFSDVSPTFKRTAVKANGDGGYVWEGEVPGQDVHEALLVVRDGQISGRVQLDQKVFSITPLGGGKHRIVELDMAAFPPEAPPVNPPHVRNRDSAPAETAQDTEAAEAVVTIRVLVAYTTNAMNEAGGKAAIEAEIRRAIALSNQAYNRAGVQITLQLAGMMRVNYTESSDIEVDLNRLTSAASLQNVRTRRANVTADLASLFRRNDPNFCGIAWFPGAGFMPTPVAGAGGTRETGYSIMNRSCVENLSFHHELGHNMGLQHDRFVVSGNPGTNFYNFGYVNLPKRQRTIMAYNNQCVANGFNCTRINYFSSPTIRPPGNVVIGKAANTPGAADNTRRLKSTRTPVSRYY